MTYMIVVADSTRARIFTTATAHSPLSEIETMLHPESRVHDRAITSDLPGKVKGRDGSGGHAFEDKTDLKKHEHAEFARQVAEYVDAAQNEHNFSKLLLVAAPAFLGELRKYLSAETSTKIVIELDKNLTQHSVDDIRKHLPEFLK